MSTSFFWVSADATAARVSPAVRAMASLFMRPSWKTASYAVSARRVQRHHSLPILHPETSSDADHLVSGLDRSHLCYLCRRRDLGIDVGLGTRESSQRAFRSRVRDALLLHETGHQGRRFLVEDDRVV